MPRNCRKILTHLMVKRWGRLQSRCDGMCVVRACGSWNDEKRRTEMKMQIKYQKINRNFVDGKLNICVWKAPFTRDSDHWPTSGKENSDMGQWKKSGNFYIRLGYRHTRLTQHTERGAQHACLDNGCLNTPLCKYSTKGFGEDGRNGRKVDKMSFIHLIRHSFIFDATKIQ